MRYSVDDCGLLIGLMKRPVGNFSEQDFYKQEIEKNLCHKYLEILQSQMKGEKPENYNMFTQIGYKTFGEHSLMSLILIDDFAYANRIFHPAHGYRELNVQQEKDKKAYIYDDYDHQIITCVNTIGKKNSTRLEPFFVSLKNGKQNCYPFICLIQAKLNSGLLMGNGIDIIELVKEAIYAIPNDKISNVKSKDIKFLVLDSLGSDELTILCFSYNLSSLIHMVHYLRCMDMKYLKRINKEKSKTIIEQSFLKKVLVSIKPDKLYDSHIFSTVNSLPGYSLDLSEKNWDNFLFHEEEKGLMIKLGFTWYIKPGHPFLFHKALQKQVEETVDIDSFQISTSLWYYELKSLYDEKDRKFSKEIFRKIEKLREIDIELKHTRKVQMELYASGEFNIKGEGVNEEYIDEVDNEHPSLKLYLKENYVFDLKFLLGLRDLLGRCGVSKVLRERLIKIYNNFNDCICDPLFFSNFIDLRDSLVLVKEKIEDYLSKGEESLEEIHNWLGLYIQSFEQAYLNRFHQSNRMKNMSDFNIEWNGGIQQLLSPFDYVYKSLYKEVYKNDSIFLHVSGYDRVHVTPFALRINIFELTYPELYVSVLWKEIFNFFWEFRYSKEDEKLNNEYFVGIKYMYSGHFINEIKSLLITDPDFNSQSEVFQTLYDGLDIDYFTCFIADSAAFYVGYNGDWDLFSYWCWEFLFQMTLHYQKNTLLSPKIFIRFLSRMQFVLLLENKSKIEDLKFQPIDPSVSTYWLNYYKDTFSFTSLLIKILDKFNFLTSIKSSIFQFLGNEMVPIFQRLKNNERKISKEKWEKEWEKELYLPEDLFEGWLKDPGNILWLRHKLFDEQTIAFRKLLDKHQIIQFKEATTPELYLHCLFSAFLKKLEDLNIGSSKPEFLFKVNTRPNQPILSISKDMLELYSNILADRLGGMFCIDYATRRECFAIRTLFYRSIFDFYHKKIACYQLKK